MDTTPATPTLRTFDQSRLHYDRSPAAGPPVVLIHGWSCRRTHWAAQSTLLSELQCPVFALDLPGHGESEPPRMSRSPQTFAQDVLALLQAERLSDAILVGHSMGGAVALEAARRAPSEVRAVILVDTFALDYGGMQPVTQQALHAPFVEDFAAAIARLVNNTAGTAADGLKQQLKTQMAVTDPQVALPAWQALLAWDPLPALRTLTVPIHAINGDLIPASARQRCEPYVKEIVLPGTGHFLHMQAPQRFNQVFSTLLEQVRED